jgi:hypothetical protein
VLDKSRSFRILYLTLGGKSVAVRRIDEALDPTARATHVIQWADAPLKEKAA